MIKYVNNSLLTKNFSKENGLHEVELCVRGFRKSVAHGRIMIHLQHHRQTLKSRELSLFI